MFQAELVLEKGHPKPPNKVPGFKRDLHVHRGMCLRAGWCWKCLYHDSESAHPTFSSPTGCLL